MSAEGCALLVNSVSVLPVLCLGHERERCLGSEGWVLLSVLNHCCSKWDLLYEESRTENERKHLEAFITLCGNIQT